MLARPAGLLNEVLPGGRPWQAPARSPRKVRPNTVRIRPVLSPGLWRPSEAVAECIRSLASGDVIGLVVALADGSRVAARPAPQRPGIARSRGCPDRGGSARGPGPRRPGVARSRCGGRPWAATPPPFISRMSGRRTSTTPGGPWSSTGRRRCEARRSSVRWTARARVTKAGPGVPPPAPPSHATRRRPRCARSASLRPGSSGLRSRRAG